MPIRTHPLVPKYTREEVSYKGFLEEVKDLAVRRGSEFLKLLRIAIKQDDFVPLLERFP
ncbi:hypothetical protein [Pyrococcus kukulkanii]|uniref:hypothetical protein n=1 Tax=Pyrococcus kukulkanii TaxID=1609559 RepID=UPI0035678DB8